MPEEMPEPGSVVRLTDVLTPMLTEAFERHAQGERVVWDFAPQLMPSGQNALMGTVGLYAQIPGAVPKTYVGMGHFMQPVADPEVVDDTVRQLMEILRTSRTEQLAAMQDEAQKAAQTGRPAPLGGLILP